MDNRRVIMNNWCWFNIGGLDWFVDYVDWLDVMDHWFNVCWFGVMYYWLDIIMMNRWFNIFGHNRIACNVLMVLISTFMHMHSVTMVMNNWHITVVVTMVFMDWFYIRFWNMMNNRFDVRWLNMMNYRFDIRWFDIRWFNIRWFDIRWFNIWLNWRRWKWLDVIVVYRCFNIIGHNRIPCNVLVVLVSTFMHMYSIAMVMDNTRLMIWLWMMDNWLMIWFDYWFIMWFGMMNYWCIIWFLNINWLDEINYWFRIRILSLIKYFSRLYRW